MTRLLHIVGSPRGGASTSLAIADSFLAAWQARNPGAEVDTLNLWAQPIPPFDGDRAAAKMTVIAGQTPEGAEATAWDSIVDVFERFARADHYLFTVPMWNSGIPWMLKMYIDTITQPGMAFGFDPDSGYTGLLRNKRATVIYTSGVYAPGVSPAFGRDFHSTYFSDWLRFIGIEEIAEIRFQPTLMTGDPDADLASARDVAREIARAV